MIPGVTDILLISSGERIPNWTFRIGLTPNPIKSKYKLTHYDFSRIISTIQWNLTDFECEMIFIITCFYIVSLQNQNVRNIFKSGRAAKFQNSKSWKWIPAFVLNYANTMAGLRPNTEIIGNAGISKFFYAILFIIQNQACTQILRCVGVSGGEKWSKTSSKWRAGKVPLEIFFLKKFLLNLV